MFNKQNPHSRTDKFSQYYTESSKSQSRYPLGQLDHNFNNVQVYSPHKQYKTYNKLNFNQMSKHPSKNILRSINTSEVSVSMRQRCRTLQINTISQLISSARAKKQQIEDLLRQQQIKSQMQDLDETQATASLRKLKKVVRLMQIVCKIILGRNQQNSYIDMNSQQDISMRQMQSISMQNYQRELASKNSEILRLKKFVEILSVPNKQLSHSLINSNSNNSMMDSVRNSFENHQFKKEEVLKLDASAQTQQISFNERLTQTQPFPNSVKAQHKFMLCEQYSLWNILDANQTKQSHKALNNQEQKNPQIFQISSSNIPTEQQKKEIKQQPPLIIPQQDRIKKLSRSSLQPIQIEGKCPFVKRFKSIVKITLNAINLCNNIFFKALRTTQVSNIASDILELTNYFNKKYHNQNGYYDDHFCKQMKDRVTQLYQRVHTIYKQTKIDRQIFEDTLY